MDSSTEEKKPTGETKEPEKPKESAYGDIQPIPVLEAVDGIRFDFNNGMRVKIPDDAKHNYHVVFMDADTHTILFSSEMKPKDFLQTNKRYYMKLRLEIRNSASEPPIFTHEYNAEGKDVMIQMPGSTIGDSIGWFSYVERFQKKHKCNVYVVMKPETASIFEKQYPDIHFIKKEDTLNYKPYATYYAGLFFKGDTTFQPMDFRLSGNHRTVSNILGVDGTDIPPRVDLSAPRKIKEPYVVIATQASSQCKYWNNPNGWYNVIKFLKDSGYKVVCIDKEYFHGSNPVFNHIPWGVENDTGEKPLQDRINTIKDADFFIGLSSGLSWLAWCCKVPVVMISGFTLPYNEFYTPYRVINYNGCTGCWNSQLYDFDHYDFFWCPKFKDDITKKFECTRVITHEHVIDTIKTIPQFQKHMKEMQHEQA